LGKSNVYQNADDIFSVNVNYNLNYIFNVIIEDYYSDGIQRNKSIFQETNPEVIQIVDNLLS